MSDTGKNKGETFWEAHYAKRTKDSRSDPNVRLVQFATDLKPGRALDLGCGVGVDTLWLAERGWQVSAVDISATALAQVRECSVAAHVGERVHVERHDLSETFPAGSFELVSAQFLQSPFPLGRASLLRAAANAVKAGGCLLIVEHGSPSPWSWFPDAVHPPPEELVRASGIAAEAWTLECSAALERQATGPKGERAVVLDNVLFARKRVAG